MVARLDFGLLRPIDLGQAVQAFDQARARRLQRDELQQQGQFRQQQVDMQQAQIDRDLAARQARAAAVRNIIMGGDGPQMAAQPATAPAMADAAPMAPATPSAAPAAPVAAAEEPMMTVTAQRQPSMWDEIIDADPDAALQLWEKSRTVGDQERQRIAAAYDTLAAATVDLARLPYEQRGQALAAMAPMLQARGVPQEVIASLDPTDANLSAAQNQALGLKEIFAIRDRAADNARQEAQFAETQRANRTREALQADAVRARREGNAISASNVSRETRRTEADLRKEFNALPEVKEWREIGNSYRQIYAQASRPNPTAQNDMAIIFSYMKMLDPGSVVREGEFANAQNAAGVPDQIRNLYNRAASGNRLNETQRRNMVASAAQIVQARQPRIEGLAAQYRGFAQDYGVDPQRVARFDRVFAPRSASGGSSRQVAGGTLSPPNAQGERVWRPGGAR